MECHSVLCFLGSMSWSDFHRSSVLSTLSCPASASGTLDSLVLLSSSSLHLCTTPESQLESFLVAASSSTASARLSNQDLCSCTVPRRQRATFFSSDGLEISHATFTKWILDVRLLSLLRLAYFAAEIQRFACTPSNVCPSMMLSKISAQNAG